MTKFADYPAIAAALTADRQLIWHTQARLFARVSHPDALMDGEAYNVDLEKPAFTGLFEDQFASGGPAQLIATFTPSDETWLWGFHNKSVSKNGWRDLRALLDGLPAITALIGMRKFIIDADNAMKLATWIARQCGYLGAYPARVGDAIAYLAVKLAGHPEASVEPDDNQWCTLCGRWSNQVDVLLSGQHGYVCDPCIDLAEGVVPTDPDPNTNYAADSRLPSCVLCDADSTPRVMYPYTSLCWECIGTAAGILRERRGGP